MLELIAKFLIYVALASGILASIIMDANILLMLTRRWPTYKSAALLDPMIGFVLLFFSSISIYWWLHV